MTTRKSPAKYISLAIAFFALVLAFAVGLSRTEAQQTFFVHLSFETQTYAPPEYLQHARTLPIPGEDAVLGANIFSPRSGGVLVPVSTSQYLFRWFLTGTKIEEAVGLDTFIYHVPEFSGGNSLRFRVEVLNLSGETVLGSASLDIPITKPKTLLYRVENNRPSLISETVFPGQPESTITILARPYFFRVKNVRELIFRWFADGELITGTPSQPELLYVRLPRDTGAKRFMLRVENSQNSSEQATTNFTVRSE